MPATQIPAKRTKRSKATAASPSAGPTPPTIHASRNAPLCVDCKHSSNLLAIGLDLACDHPSVPVNVVSGRSAVRCVDMRHRDASYACGPDGQLFEPDAPRASTAHQAIPDQDTNLR